MADAWYEPSETKAEADGQQRQPEFALEDEFNLPTYTDGDAPLETGFSEAEVALMDRMNAIKAITDSI